MNLHPLAGWGQATSRGDLIFALLSSITSATKYLTQLMCDTRLFEQSCQDHGNFFTVSIVTQNTPISSSPPPKVDACVGLHFFCSHKITSLAAAYLDGALSRPLGFPFLHRHSISEDSPQRCCSSVLPLHHSLSITSQRTCPAAAGHHRRPMMPP